MWVVKSVCILWIWFYFTAFVEFAYTLGIFVGNNIIAKPEEISPGYCLILHNSALDTVRLILLWQLAL